MNPKEGSTAGLFVKVQNSHDRLKDWGVTVWCIQIEHRSAAMSQRSRDFLTQEDAGTRWVKVPGYRASAEKAPVYTNHVDECTRRDM